MSKKCHDLEIGVRGHSRSLKWYHSVENRTKIAYFPTSCVFSAPLKGFPWNWVSAQGSEETRMMGLPDSRKSFKIGLAVLIQYRRVSDRHPASHPATSASRSKKQTTSEN